MSPTYIYIFNLVLVLILVLLNAFFVVSEFSIVKIRKTKLEELAHNGNKRAKIALKITDHLDSYLSAIQLGITLASLGLGWIGEPAVSKLLENTLGGYFSENPILLHSVSFGVAFTFITVLHVVLGELIPKSLAIQKTETYVLLIAYPLYTFKRIFYPFIWVLDMVTLKSLKMMGVQPASEEEMAHSEEEIKLIVNASQRGGVIDDTERDIIQNAIDFSEICAHEVMIPRQDMSCLFLNDSFEQVMQLIKRSKHTRYPLCDKDRDNVVGMIHIRDLLEHCEEKLEKGRLNKIARQILFVPENQSVSEVLHLMMRKHTHVAIVVDEYGGTAGMLSMEDILEELVGDIMDEHDVAEAQEIQKVNEQICEFDGKVLIEDAYECMNLPCCERDESTIGGYVFTLLGRAPKVGDKVEDEYCHYEVISSNKMRVKRVRVQIKEQEQVQEEI
ncbi:MAG: HlyC/CorC family transporter [Alphaproteobacteria bacterium]|nr:HlyC/CorC family transporter [Alphaproteobacteria bacterium]